MIILSGCSSESTSDTNPSTANYDKEAMLTSWADNIIIPSFTYYQLKVNTLNESTFAFTETANAENLALLRDAWLEAYKAYQHVGIFDTGKATKLHLLEASNTYPTSTKNITTNITTGDYNLNTQAQYASQGFPALDYLLYGLADTDAAVLAFYTTNADASNYKAYLTDLSAQLNTIANAIVADWNGGYRETFISNSNAVTGSLNQTANNFVKNLEKDIRAPKIGIPAGEFSNGAVFPEKVEAFYKNDISKLLSIEAIYASHDFFNGIKFGTSTSGPGLKEFLDAVGATSSGQSLSDIINNQYDTISHEVNKLDNSFSSQITTNNNLMLNAYEALQQNVVYLKVDMISALSLTIDYVDGDGD